MPVELYFNLGENIHNMLEIDILKQPYKDFLVSWRFFFRVIVSKWCPADCDSSRNRNI